MLQNLADKIQPICKKFIAT